MHNHLTKKILGDHSQGVWTRLSHRNIYNHLAFLSHIEPKYFQNTKNNKFWINVIQEELNQFERNEVWHLVPRPSDHPVIGMLLAFTYFKDFKLYQIDVKSAFLNGFITKEIYIEQPLNFEDSKFFNHVFKLTKVLYGLKQAPWAWYKILSKF